MSDINFCTFNCRGLGDFQKRKDVFNYLRKTSYNIIFLQDIHCSHKKVLSFRNAWGKDIIVSSFSNNARGVAILTKSIDISFEDTRLDDLGNFIITRALINQTFEVILANIYGPNKDDPDFFSSILCTCETLKNGKDLPVIWAGDLNISMNHQLDTYNYSRRNNPRGRDRVKDIMNQHNMTDIFRSMNQQSKKYTWRVGNPPRKKARLDYFLISESLVPLCTQVDIVPGYRSDHSIVKMSLTLIDEAHGKGYYKMNSSLLSDDHYVKKMKDIINETVQNFALPVYSSEFVINNPTQVNVVISWGLFWETLVLNMRTETISYSIFKNRKLNEEESYLTKHIHRLEAAEDDNVDNQTEIARSREKLEALRKIKIDGIIARSRARWYENGEKSSSYFLNLEKRNYVNKIISALRMPNQDKIIGQKNIMAALVHHFRNLFTEKPISDREADIFVSDLHVKQISNRQKEWLEEPLTIDDLRSALQNMSNNKAPGTDGFPTEFFKIFWNDLKQYFFRMVQESYEAGTLPATLKEGIITLIPKPNKPRDEINSYRPITLLNSSYKIVASAIANKIKKILPDVIGHEQTGFMTNRFIGDNTRLTYDIMQYLKNNDRTALLLSLDIQDAFNSVNWNFARIVLKKRNFPEYIINWFNTLYVDSTSRIVYRGHISDTILLQRSCRQGDPLSPYIFFISNRCSFGENHK